MLSEVRYGVEVEVERLAREELVARERVVPAGDELQRLRVSEAGRVFAEVAPLGSDVEAGEERKAFVGGERHDVALAFDGPELEREHRAQRVTRGDHLGAGELRGAGESVDAQADEVRDEEEEPSAGGGERA